MHLNFWITFKLLPNFHNVSKNCSTAWNQLYTYIYIYIFSSRVVSMLFTLFCLEAPFGYTPYKLYGYWVECNPRHPFAFLQTLCRVFLCLNTSTTATTTWCLCLLESVTCYNWDFPTAQHKTHFSVSHSVHYFFNPHFNWGSMCLVRLVV